MSAYALCWPEPALPLSALPGWLQEDHLAAMQAAAAACRVSRDPSMAAPCRDLRAAPPKDDAAARRFLETRFRARPLAGDGLLTAYFAPEYQARDTPDATFTAPVRPRPGALDALIAQTASQGPSADAAPPGPAADPGAADVDLNPDRAAIQAMPADDALAWMRPEELFFLQIQGSGVLTFPDGRRLKAVFAASNGKPFVGLARIMRDEGLIDGAHTSGEAILAWLADHRGPEAEALMDRDPRYVFFTLRPDDGQSPAGAAGIPLPPGRALAIDPAWHAMGELFWIDADAPGLAGGFPAYRRLAAGLDTGGAIKGDIRADLYTGVGEAAGREAGRVRHTLRLYWLEPVGEGP